MKLSKNMAVAPLRRRAGMIEIKNKERKIREELEARKQNETEQEVSEDEHQNRLNKLRELGLIK